jgi:hypothetical protein
MAKYSRSKAALSHAIAYAYEEMEDFYNTTGKENNYDDFNDVTSLKELIRAIDAADFEGRKGQHENIEAFYKAMFKVVPHIDYPEHSGTECRGWYRVWAAATGLTGYFCEFDFGRDVSMLYDLFEHGAITEAQYVKQRAKNTLSFAKSIVDDNGSIDTTKMKDYFLEDWVKKCLDVRLLYAFSLAADEKTATFAHLIYE